MKKALYLFVSLAIAHSTMARIIRVAPNTLSGALFTTAQAAHNAANPGDSIYLEGISSPLDYGVLTITTPIVLMGQGWLVNESANTQYIDQSSRINTIYIRPSAAGTKIMGVYGQATNLFISANNVSIDRSNFGFIYIGEFATLGAGDVNITGFLVQRSYFSSIYYNQRTVSIFTYYGIVSNGLIRNNIIFYVPNGYLSSTFKFDNNVFSSGSVSPSNLVRNSAFYNNIFQLENIIALISGNSNSLYNNFAGSSNTSFWNGIPGSGNVRANIFSDAFLQTGNSYGPTFYKAIDGGVADNAGSDGTDIGPFGGSTPYIPFGIPPLPAITNMQVPAYIGGNTINVTIDAQINR